MPQARLPDINTSFTKHRNEAINSLKSKNYAGTFGSLYAWNALLPDIVYSDTEDPELAGKPKYRIVISDIEYNKLAKPSIYLFCYHCDPNDENGFTFESIKYYNLLLPIDIQQLTRKKFEKGWYCPKCKKVNWLAKTRRLDKIAETRLKEPSFLGVVPNPPKRQGGLIDHTKYHNAMERWTYTMIAELENKSAQFRDDNWSKEEQLKEEAIADGGETA